MDIKIIFTAVSSLNTLKEFIVQGEMAEMLSLIGDTHAEAAALSLRGSDRSSQPTREVELAIGHLQAAHVAFKKFYIEFNEFSRYFHLRKTFFACMKDQQVNLLMAMCYCYLGERELMEESLENVKYAICVLDRLGSPWSLNVVAAFINFRHWLRIFKGIISYEEDLSLDEYDLAKITQALRKLE